jgi:putative transposase
MRIFVFSRAKRDIGAALARWKANHPDEPGHLEEDLASAFVMLKEHPYAGAKAREPRLQGFLRLVSATQIQQAGGMAFLAAVLEVLLALIAGRDLVLESLALRQQLAILRRTSPRPRLRASDRIFWVALRRVWSGWANVLALVQPATVVAWHRAGFRLLWRWKSGRPGRPRTHDEVRALIRKLARENLLWGAPRIHGELLKLGFDVSESTVQTYMGRRRRPGSGGWRTFLRNHGAATLAVDFVVIPTATFQLLYGFVVLEHGRRRIRHVSVTAHPTADWAANALLEALPWECAFKYLLRDRDGIYGRRFRERAKALLLEAVLSAPKSPWQSAYVERCIGSIRRDLLDHVIVFGEDHAQRLLRAYAHYYNDDRTHLGLFKDTPHAREVEPPSAGRIESRPVLGGLHHRYFRRAA